ncbi:MAG: hypothetical protein SPK87_07580 [Bacteroidales bacterium]|nr:hypothetical protein [Bacteroidales bacterium]
MHVGDAEALDAGGGHVGLAVEHVDLLLEGHLGDDGVDLLVIDGQLVLRGLRRRRAGGQAKGEACEIGNGFDHGCRFMLSDVSFQHKYKQIIQK